MSDYSIILTDQEIRSLIMKNILEGDMDSELINNMITMESKMVFSTPAAVLPAIGKEQELVSKLSKAFTKSVQFTWPIISLVTALIVTSFIAVKYYKHKNAEQAVVTATAPIAFNEEKPKSVTEEQLQREIKLESTLVIATHKQQMPTNALITEKTENQTVNTPSTSNNEVQTNIPIEAESSSNEKQSNVRGLVESEGQFTIDTLFEGINKLEIESKYCKINIQPNSNNQLVLKGEMNFTTKGIIINQPKYKITLERVKSVLKVIIYSEEKSAYVLGGCNNVSGFLNFSVPPLLALQIDNCSSDINISGVDGEATINNTYGNISLTNMRSNINATNKSANLTLSNITGDIVSKCDFGNQQYSDIKGNIMSKGSSGQLSFINTTGNLDVKTSFSNAKVIGLKGNLRIKSASGNITASNIIGDTIDLSATFGKVEITNSSAHFNVKSSSGNINLSDLKGNVKLTSSFGQQKIYNIEGNIVSKNKSGSIDLSNVKGDLNLSNSFGNIKASDCKGSMQMNVSSGSIIGKGITVVEQLIANNTFGNIKMELLNEPSELSYNLSSTFGNIKVQKGNIHTNTSEGSFSEKGGKINIIANTSSGSQLFE